MTARGWNMPDGPVIGVCIDATGVVRAIWAEGTYIDERLARHELALIDEVTGGRAHALLVDISGVVGMSRGSRAIFAKEHKATRIALVGRSAVSRVIAIFALGIKPQPLRYFTSETRAITWLLDADDFRASPGS